MCLGGTTTRPAALRFAIELLQPEFTTTVRAACFYIVSQTRSAHKYFGVNLAHSVLITCYSQSNIIRLCTRTPVSLATCFGNLFFRAQSKGMENGKLY